MDTKFQPHGRAALVGSLPLSDHQEACRLVFAHTPEIPSWAQLPAADPREQMVPQFAPGMPGYTRTDQRAFVDTGNEDFAAEMLQFYETYLAVTAGEIPMEETIFAVTPDMAPGFFVFLERIGASAASVAALKGQITGPITFCTGLRDQNDRAIFYDAQARDAAVKLLALKAGWQTRQLARYGLPVLVSVDEPALAGYGSSEMISVSREEIGACLQEVIRAIHQYGGIAGVHVCANTDWSLILDSEADIVNFDAYGYFDRFVLYADALRKFLAAGKIIAWGIVPTQNPTEIEKETPASLAAQWRGHVQVLDRMGLDREMILAQSLITPSCGVGSLGLDHARKVLEMTREVSQIIRGSG